jgi:hypothetical protein
MSNKKTNVNNREWIIYKEKLKKERKKKHLTREAFNYNGKYKNKSKHNVKKHENFCHNLSCLLVKIENWMTLVWCKTPIIKLELLFNVSWVHLYAVFVFIAHYFFLYIIYSTLIWSHTPENYWFLYNKYVFDSYIFLKFCF